MWRLRPGIRNPRSGTPRVAVRPYYEGLPSMAGRGTEQRRRKPHGHVGTRSPGPSPEARLRGEKPPQWSAGRRACRSHGTRRLRQGARCYPAPFGAPLPHAVREGRGRRTQKRVYARLRRAMADQTAGAMTHARLPHKRGAAMRRPLSIPGSPVIQDPKTARTDQEPTSI